MRKLMLIMVGLVIIAVLWATFTTGGQILTGRWSYTEKAYVDQGTYFRLKVGLTYRGEPQHFDIVVGCNVVSTGYKDGSGTREVGLVPTVYGRQMSDGKGLVVRVPDACHGQTTAKGNVPSDFMPVMIVYDDANTLDFGKAYVAEEAYDSPRSLMKFGQASVEKATRSEFDDFRTNGQPNLVTRNQYHSAQPRGIVEQMGLKKIYPAFGRSCWAYSRSLIPEKLRANVRKYWPADRPKYWMIPDHKSLVELRETFNGADFSRDDGGKLLGTGPWISSERPKYGALRHRGSTPSPPGIGQRDFGPPAFYPFTSDVPGTSWPTDPNRWNGYASSLSMINILNVSETVPENRGFAYCFELPDFSSNDEAMQILETRPASFTIGNRAVEGAPRNWSPSAGATKPIFEGDQFIYYHQQFYLESTRGDV